MSDTKAFASLSPTLLARKGGARPAMRQFHESAALQLDDDFGWNDMGESSADARHEAQIVPIHAGWTAGQAMPEVPGGNARPESGARRTPAERRSALADGRRAAFTLRIDADRHLKLRLASTIANRSAQQLVTEALDRFLDEMPQVETLAKRIADAADTRTGD